jgi:hypothetical protein
MAAKAMPDVRASRSMLTLYHSLQNNKQLKYMDLTLPQLPIETLLILDVSFLAGYPSSHSSAYWLDCILQNRTCAW